jgi:HK97 family phage prohead protease
MTNPVPMMNPADMPASDEEKRKDWTDQMAAMMGGKTNPAWPMMMNDTEHRAVWDTSYVNDLPDSAFLLIGSGGRKDADGKTVPRSLRHFPVRNAAGDVDLPHLRNALAQIPKASTLTPAQRQAAMDKAKSLAKSTSVGGAKGEYSGKAGSGRAREPAAILTRTFEAVFEVRDAGDGRTLIGRAVPYGETITFSENGGGRERFEYGAFAEQIRSGQVHAVKMYDSHQARMSGQQPIGKTATLTETPQGLFGSWPLYNTTRANDALELVRTGEVTGLSIGFKPIGRTTTGPQGELVRAAAHLDHIVLTHEPAYAGAVVTAIRSARPLATFRREAARHHQLLDHLP